MADEVVSDTKFCLPVLFVERLKLILPPETLNFVLTTFKEPDLFCLRVNDLLWDRTAAVSFFKVQGFDPKPLDFCSGAFLFSSQDKVRLKESEPLAQGKLYWQNPSSLIPPLVLRIQPEDSVLDLCAAPGSKTSQMSALMGGRGFHCCDRSRT
jgi:16S rRNA C967 or C1407 C5-methylase (RsmB/RsmF family)